MVTPDAAPTATGGTAAGRLPTGSAPTGSAPTGNAAGQVPRDGSGRPDFVVVDVETTGWDPGVARITELAAVRISGGGRQELFSSLVNPECPVPAPVAELTGITDALVAEAPGIAEVLAGFLDFARGAVLTAHNAPFDVGFLTAACQASGLPWPDFTVLDTVAIARATLRPGEVPDCKLATLARYFGTAVTPSHRALPDALATAGVLDSLLGRLAAIGVHSVAEISRLAGAAAVPAARRPGQAGRAGWRRRLSRLRRRARALARGRRLRRLR